MSLAIFLTFTCTACGAIVMCLATGYAALWLLEKVIDKLLGFKRMGDVLLNYAFDNEGRYRAKLLAKADAKRRTETR